MSKQNKNLEAIYPLSPMQQGMLFHTLYAPNSGMYVEQLVCTLNGNLNVKAFHQAWQRVVERHQILRTLFVWEQSKQPLQIVCKTANLPWFDLDWQELSLVEQQQRLEKLLQSERKKGFKLDQAPLMRCTLIKVQPDTYQFIWSHHHLLMDGWCLSIILKEVLAYYEAEIQGEDIYLSPPRPYKDYISWLQQQDLSQAEVFWRKALEGFTTPTSLSVDKLRWNNLQQGHIYEEQKLFLPKALTSSLQSLAKETHLTLNTIIQGAWALLLHRYSNESDVVFGTTISGRPSNLPGVESMVGLFINTMPVRVQIESSEKLLPWLKNLQTQLIEIEEYAYSPLAEIQAWSDVPRGRQLFESLVVFENYPLDVSLREERSSLKVSDVRGFERTNYPLTVVVIPGSELSVQLSYDAQRFDATSIQQILGHFQNLLADIVAKPQANLYELEILTKAEQQQILAEWNNTKTSYPKDKSIHELFELQVAKNPNAVAVVCDGKQLTYQELNNRANSLAHYLRTLGVGPNVLVGISVERSLEMIVGLLGILKAGGGYVPIDPAYPAERLLMILSDSQVKVLLTQQHLVHQLPNLNLKQVYLDTDWEAINQNSQENPVNTITPENVAYVIYTSGSTGKPKGVLVTQYNVVRLFQSTSHWYGFDENDVWTLFHSFAFDFSVWEIWGALLHGGRLVIVPYDISRNPQSFLQLIRDEKVTVLNQTPSAFTQLLVAEKASPPKEPTTLRYIIFGGEALNLQSLRPWFELHGEDKTTLVNMYGITETTVHVTYRPITLKDLENRSGSVIGEPIPDLRLYLLDAYGDPVPPGVMGEIYVGGAGVTRGYLNRPEQNAERFIQDKFSTDSTARLYRSGDLGRFLPNGDLEYLGRIDHQVKIRGFRIEIGEIEAVLQQHLDVSHVVVLVREDQPEQKRIVAYVVLHQFATTTVKELRDFLKVKLPEYMLPSAFVVLESLPINHNGKVDRRALPAPDIYGNTQDDTHLSPFTPTEEVVAAVWQEILGAKVGINVNFFDAGGHSLLATQVVSRLQKAFDIKLPLQYLFEYPTVAELSECIDKVRKGEQNFQIPAIEPVSRTENLPLSFAQQRLWFLDQLEGGSSTYNVPIALELKGSLNAIALEQSLAAIVQRHEVLRTSFPTVDSYPVQAIAASCGITLAVVDLQSLSEKEQSVKVQQLVLETAQQPFDLANEPLLRASLLRLDEKCHILLLVMHHIVCDGWSMGILLRELYALYAGFAQGVPTSLPELPIQYADFAYWQHQWLQGQVLETNLSYWKQQLANLTTLELPTDYPRPALQTFRGKRQNLELSKDLSEDIKALSRSEGTTLFMTLMAAFNTLLHCYAGQDDIAIGTDIANRNRVETEGVIGFFVNQLVIRTDLSGNPTFRNLLGRVRQVTMDAYDHQDMPFDQLVATLNPERDLRRTPLFQSKFVLQNAPMPTMELEDLTLKVLEIEDDTAKFDLLLTLWETEQGLTGNLEFSTDLFNTDTISRMIADFETILRAVIAQPNTTLQYLKEILREKTEQQQVGKAQAFQQLRRNNFKNFKAQSVNGKI
jgi:amino acid adenylation domain-containing protein